VSWDLGAESIRRSWTGAGSLEINGPDDHFELRDYLVVFVFVATIDLVTYLVGALFMRADDVPCGPPLPPSQMKECFADPNVAIHNALLYVWLTAVIAVLTIAVSAAWKTGRAVVAAFQGVIFAVALIVAMFTVLHAQGQRQELRLCHYGAAGPCFGADRVS
jgi:hypothetical protein